MLRRKRKKPGVSIVNPESVPKAWEHLMSPPRTPPVLLKSRLDYDTRSSGTAGTLDINMINDVEVGGGSILS